MNKPVTMILLVAGGMAAGALADHAWNATNYAEGAQCVCSGRIAAAGALPAMVPAPLAAAPAYATGAACTGNAAYPNLAASSPVVAAAAPAAAPAPAAPACSQPTAAPIAPPVAAPVSVVDPAPRLAAERSETNDSSGLLIAIGGFLGLIGLGWALRRKPREDERRDPLPAFVATAAAAGPLAFAERLDDGAWSQPPEPPLDAETRDDARTYTPHEAGISPFSRRASKAGKKARRRLGLILLATGGVAAIAASVTRVPITEDAETVAHVVSRRAATVLPTGHRDPTDPAAHGKSTPVTWIGGGGTGHGTGSTVTTPLAQGRIGPNLGGGGGQVRDRSGTRLAEVDQSSGARQGFHEFGAGGSGDGRSSDPQRGRGEGSLKSDEMPGGGGGGSGGGSSSGGSSSGGATSSGGSSSGGSSSGGDQTSSGGSSSSGGATSSSSGGGASSGGSSSGGTSSGGTSSGSSSSGGSSSGGDGKDAGDLIGTEPGHGGAVDVPEPDTIGLLALGVIGLAVARSRRLRQRLARLGANAGKAE